MKTTRLTLTILLIITFINTTFGQQIYPVALNGSLIPPFSLTLSDYATTRTQDIIFNATLNDPVEPSRQVYFRVIVKHNGQEIYRTNPNYIGTPITLQQFSPQMITGSELADYLNPVNLVAVGSNQITNRLPDGFNQICLEVIDFQRQVPISRQACIGGLFKQLQAPLLELPACGATANIGQTQNLMFRWLPRHLGQPNAPSSVRYTFTLVELPQGFTNAFDVFDKSLKIYETTSFNPTLFYTDTEPQLSEGKTYAWQVQAKDPAGSNVFDNNGKSPVCTFTVKKKTNTTVATNNIIPNCGAPITAYGPISYNAPKSELLAVGDDIKLGHFDMKITQITTSGNSYSGEGTVHVPFLKAHVKVDFQDLKIDPRKQAYQSGKIRAKYDVNMNIQESDLNPAGLRNKLNGNLRNQLKTLVAMPTAGGRKVSKRSASDNTPIGLPLIMDRKDAQGNDLPAVVLLDLQFSEKDAKLAAVALDEQGTNSLTSTGLNVGFTPKGIGQSRGLALMKDYNITLADGSVVKILGGDKTLAQVDCNGFAGYNLKGKYIFSRNTLIPADGSQGKVSVDFTGKGKSFSDFIVDLKQLPNFQLPTVKDYIFTLTNGKFDYSTTSNPSNIQFPNVYSDVKDNTWRGLSFEKTTVQLPNQWNFGSNTALTMSNGATVIAKDGLYTNLADNNILSLNQGKIKDWRISIDKIDLAFSKSQLDKSDLEGKIKISVLDDPFTFKGKMTANNNGDIDIEIKPDGTTGKLGLWKGEIQFTKDALVKVITRNVSGKKQFFPSADLHGGFTLNIDSTQFTKNVIGNAGSKVNRLKQALKYSGKPSLSIKGLDLKGFMVDPSTSVSKRFVLKDYQASVLANSITVGNKEYEPNSVKILYEPKTNANPARLGFEVLVQEGINVVAITVWGKQANNGQFSFSHIDLDTRLVDCDCVSNGSDKYKSYGSKIDWNDEAFIASNYDGADGVNVAEFFRTKADKFEIKDRGGKKYVVIPYLNNIELEIVADANGHFIAQGERLNQQEITTIKDDKLNAAHSLDLSNYKIDDQLLGELVGHTGKSGVDKLPIDIKPWIKQFLGKYDETKYKFPDKYHLILAGLTIDKSLEAASARIIFMGKRDNTWLTFANGNVILKPKEVGFSVLPLYLTEDIKDADPQFPMTFKKVLKNEPTEGSFAAIRCEGFEKFNIQSVYTTSGLQQAKTNAANAVEIIGTSAEIPFIIRGRDLIDFIAPINTTTAKSFVLKGDGGKLFTIKKGFIDCDSKNNPTGHPSNKKDKKGVFLAEADMMVWGFMKKAGGGRVPLQLAAKNLVYNHATGLDGTVKQDNPVPSASKSDMDGWNYILEKAEFVIEKNAFTKQNVKGKIELPIVKDGEFMGFSGKVGWDATNKIPTAVFNVDLNSKQYFNMPFLPGVQLYTDGGSEVGFTFAKGNTRSEFAPNAKLTGKMGVLLTPNNPAFKDLTPEIIKKLPLELALGLEFTDMKINHPDDINSKKGCVDSKGVVGGIKTFSVATFGVASSNVFGNDPIKDNPRFQALKDKSTGVLEGFPISISGVSFKCQQHKTGQGAAAKYEDMFKLEFTISVNLMPGEDESDVDASTTEDKNKIDDDDDPIADIAGLFGDDSNSNSNNNNNAAPAGGKQPRTAGIAAAGQFGIWFKPEKDGKGGQDLVFDHVNLDALAIDGKFSILTIKGSLLAYIDDATYGDGFKGYVKIDITSGGSGGGKSGAAKGFQIQGMTQFGTAAFDYGNGNSNPTKYKDKPYRYFFVDIEAIMKQGVGGKVALHGLGGGFFFNMARKNSKTLEDERSKAFDRKVAADKRAAANKKLKPIVPKKPTLPDEVDYNNPAFTGVDSVAFTPGATFSGYQYYPQKGVYGGYLKGIFSVMKRPDLAAFDIALGLELKKNSKGSLGLSKIFAKGDLYMQGDADITLRKDAPGQGTIDITYDHVNKALTCDFGFNFEIVQTFQKITMSGTGGMYFGFGANKKWYVKIGKPQLADRITSAFAFGIKGGDPDDYIDLNATRAYLQFGHDLDNLPRLSEVIPGWPASLDNQDKTRPDLSGGDGLVFGLNYQMAEIDKKFLMFRARLNAGGGFDVSLKKYSPAPECVNTSNGKLGVEGWYAKGQAYMYLSAGVDIDVDLWFYKGSVNIFDAMAAIALQAQLPNPTWLRGVFYGRYSVLGGALEGDLNFQFELGEKCKIKPGTDFLNKVDMITALLPENNEKKFPIFSDLGAGFAVPINRQFLVETMDVNQNDIIRRFMPFVKRVELKKASGERIDGKLELSQTGYEMSFRPYNVLEGQTDYVFTVEMGWKELENNKWVVVPQGEIKTANFKTDVRPDRIYKGMIATMTPGENQRYWHKNYGTAQMIFKGSYGYLFPSTSTELKRTSELTKNMTNNGKDIPDSVPLEYYVEAKEYNKSGQETKTIRIPIYSNHNESYTLWEERIKRHNNLEVGIPYLTSISRSGRRLVFDKLNTIDFCKGCMVALTIKREPARSYIAIKSAENYQNQITRKDTVQKQEIVNGVVTTKSETQTTTVTKKVTTLSNSHIKGLGELYGTYYTAYFAVSELKNLAEKVGPYEKNATQVGKGNLPNYYEFPYNYNLPRSTWLKGIDARPAYYVVDTKEPLDKYDLARLRANTKREDRTADQVDFYTKTYERLKRESSLRHWYSNKHLDWSYQPPSKAKFRLNWSKMHSSSTAGGTIQDFLNRNKYRDLRQKVLMQNFYKYVMQEYYKVDGWSSKIVANKNLKLEITPTERGAKKLNNNFRGSFEGLSGYQGSHSFGFMILDDYILNLQGKAAQIIAEDIYAKRGKWQTVQERINFFAPGPSRTVHKSPSGWTWKIWYNNYENLQYFLKRDGNAKRDFKDPYQYRNRSDYEHYRERYGYYGGGINDYFYYTYIGIRQWKYMLEQVSDQVRQRSSGISFKSKDNNGGIKYPNKKGSNTSITFWNSVDKVDIGYDRNSTFIKGLGLVANRYTPLFAWNKDDAETYTYRYNAKKELIGLDTKYGVIELGDKQNIYGDFNKFKELDIKLLTDDKRIIKYDYKVNSGRITLTEKRDIRKNYYGKNEKINTPIVRYDFDYGKSELLVGYIGKSAYITIYEVNNGKEDKRVGTFSPNSLGSGYHPIKIGLTPGKTYHIYQRGDYSYGTNDHIWYKLDDTFWKTNNGRLRTPNSESLPDNVFNPCKVKNIGIEAGSNFAFRFTPKTKEAQAGESLSSWQSPNHVEIGKWTSSSSDFTIEVRVKPEKGNATILDFTNNTFKIENNKAVLNLNGVGKFESKSTLTEGKWYHLAVVYQKSSQEVRFYINSILDKVEKRSGNWSGYAGTQQLKGNGAMVLDDIAIWKTARTRQQLIASATSPQPIVERDLLLRYDFGSGISDRTLLDLSKNRLHGVIKGGDCYCDYEKSSYTKDAPVSASMSYDYVLDFDGDEYVNIPNINLQNGAFTTEGWIKVKANTKDVTFVGLGDTKLQIKPVSAFNNKFKLGFTAKLQDNSTKTITSTDFLQLDKWHYIALVQDAFTGGKTNIRILIDGVQSGQLKAVSPIKVNSNLRLGGDGTTNANVVMDEWRVWSIPRKISDIAYMIKNGLSPSTDLSKQLVHYDFDRGGPGKAELTDNTRYLKHGALTQMEVNEDWVLSDRTKIPSLTGDFVLRFDGNKDFVKIPHQTKLNVGNNFTFEFWAKSKTSSSGQTWLIRKQNSYGVYFMDNNALGISTWGEDAGFGVNTYIIDDKWHHYTITGESGKEAILYIDGVVVKKVSGNFSPNQGGDDVYLGGVPNGKNANVMVEHVMVWNRTLSLAEVRKHAVKPTTETKDLVLHYNFDAGRGKTALGRSSNRINGVLSTDMKDDDWIPLKEDLIGDRAIDFDGKDDYLKGKSKATFTGDLNIEAWINVDKLHEYRPYFAQIAGIVDTAGTATLRLAKVENQWRLQGAVTLQDGSQIFVNDPTPITVKKWYKAKLFVGRNMVQLVVNDKEVAKQTTNSPVKASGTICIGGNKHFSFFDGVIDDVRINGEHFAFNEFRTGSFKGDKGTPLDTVRMDINKMAVPDNQFTGQAALIYPNAETNRTITTDKLVYSPTWDAAYKGRLGFSIAASETIEEIRINDNKTKLPFIFWTKDKPVIRYNYKTVQGKLALDHIDKSVVIKAMYRGDFLPINLPYGMYDVEIKVNGKWYKTTHEVAKAPRLTKF